MSLASMTIKEQEANSLDGPINVHHSNNAPLTIEDDQDAAASVRNERKLETDLVFVDYTGSQVALNPNLTPPRISRSLSPTPSFSSDEVIVFAGRKPAWQKASKQDQKTLQNSASENSQHRFADDDRVNDGEKSDTPVTFAVAERIDRLQEPSRSNENQSRSRLPIPEDPGSQKLTLPSIRSRHMRQKRQTSIRLSRPQTEEEEILADYIANMDDIDILEESLGGLARNEPLAQNPRIKHVSSTAEGKNTAENAINALLDHTLAWDSDDIRDFDDLSTSSENYPVVDKILSKRQRPTGEQYLVIGRHQSADDARWIPIRSMDSPNARNCIANFELTQADLRLGLSHSEDSEDSIDDALLDADVQEDLDSIEDERDLVERRQARMTDEQIARLLCKQEELGLGSSELLLFDGDDDDDEDMEDSPPGGGRGAVPKGSRTAVKIPKKGRKEEKHGQPHDAFTSGSLFADGLEQNPYGNFDVMDHDRLSLRKNLKARRGAPTFGLSDSELEASLQSAFERDRSTKKLRKKEREELRAQGLLGRTGQPSLNDKYREGMTSHQVKDEVINFMSSSNQRYTNFAVSSLSEALTRAV